MEVTLFTVNIILHLNLEMKQGWGKESRFRSALPCSQRWVMLPRLARVLLPARFHGKPLLSLDHFVCVSDWVGERFICTDIWWCLLTSVTHQPLACGDREVQALFFAQTRETATNYLKTKGLGSIEDHVPCGLYKKATSVGRNFSQLKVRKIICDYWMVWVFLECQSMKIVLEWGARGILPCSRLLSVWPANPVQQTTLTACSTSDSHTTPLTAELSGTMVSDALVNKDPSE